MRKYLKDQCLQSLGLLMEAQEEAGKLVGGGEALLLLAQCQQAAADIGTVIEGAEGEGTKAAGFLEEYCELVYRLHEALGQRAPAARVRRLQDGIRRALAGAEQALRRDIPVRLEAVFLPYKASMWDSLESVWRAADEDPACDALVVPIPYYDRNPDGSLGELHYELDRFPPDVPVISCDAYDFESRHPDIIFIHNPYDEGNYVTSVPPFFYSANLKRFTDRLVYIPYFVLGDIDPSDGEETGKMEHFCTTAGVANADYVVVQSEEMRQVYVDVLVKHTGEGRRAYWEKKILGLGSPKEDRVRRLRRGDFELPEEWEKRVAGEGGSRRKIIFYNTSVSALLKHGEVMLDKIRENFRFFRECSGRITLWWRPHPLSVATLASMYPQLLAQYQEIVREYKEAGFGIYDDSPDLDRAIAISDAYYGDWSSVVWLYRKTGKPVMIQRVDAGSSGDGTFHTAGRESVQKKESGAAVQRPL